jgi:hypothetical protein
MTPPTTSSAPASPAAPASAAAPPAGGTAPSSSASAATVTHEIVVPAGTIIPIVLDTAVGSDTSRVEQPVRAHVARAITVGGVVALPQGTAVTGVVTEAVRGGRVKGRARLALRFDTVVPRGGERYAIASAAVARTASATKQRDALEIAAPAAGGAIIGSLVGGRTGALAGAGIGGGAGAAYVLSTRGKDVRLGRRAPLTLRLTRPLTLRMNP